MMTDTPKPRLIITGAAGLIGQNLITRFKARGDYDIVAIDKHPTNIVTLRDLHPDITVIEADLAQPGIWQEAFAGGGTLILNHAQIGALDEQPFIDNNVTATRNVLQATRDAGINYIVHISSSVVNSRAVDFYTESKKAQEKLVVESGIPACILRPTLMFGWFDRKHLGWLARFMQKVPVFPVPGNGKFIRQPLYAGDFCSVIMSAVDAPRPGEAYDISGREKLYYIDLIKALRTAIGSRTPIIKIPYGLFELMLRTYALVDKNPPFTVNQLEALVIPEEFEIIDWPGIFGVKATPLSAALAETHQHPVYSKINLEF